MTLTLTLNNELEQQLKREASRQGLSVVDYTAKIITRHVEAAQRASATIDLLESWLSEDPDEQRETGNFLVQALNEDRLSSRLRFPPDAKGKTW